MRIKKHFPAAAFFAAVQKQNIVIYEKRFFIMPVSKNGKISDKISVGFFFGGKSVEHEVSVITGLQAMYAADTEKYRTVPVYITKQGEMYTGGKIGEIEAYGDIKTLLAGAVRVILVNDNGHFLLTRYPSKLFGNNVIDEIEAALPVVHGTNVEDGALQGYFKTIGVPFAGCDVCASAIGMDKAVTKAVLKEAGIPVLDCVCVSSAEYYDDSQSAIQKIEDKTEYPVIVKPLNLGSSVGVSKAKDNKSLIKSLENAFSFSTVVLVENAVQNLKEINCAVLGDSDNAVASVCEEPVNGDEILSYNDKYINGSGKNGTKSEGAKASGGTKSSGMANLKRKIPAEISPELEERVKEYSVKAFKAIGCSGVTRIDYLYDTVAEKLYLNELNTIPGSLAFYLWEASGTSFSTLIDELVKLAFKKQRQLDELNFSFDTNILKGIKLNKNKGAKNS